MKKELTILVQQSGLPSEDISIGKIRKQLENLDAISVRGCKNEAPFFKDFVEILAEAVTAVNEVGDTNMELLIISSEIIYGDNFLNSLDAQKLSMELKGKFPKTKIIWAIFDYYPLLNPSHPNIDFCFECTSLDPNKTLAKEIKVIWKKLIKKKPA